MVKNKKQNGRKKKPKKVTKSSLLKAIEIAGGVTNLAIDIGISQSKVSLWLHTDTQIPAHHVPKIVKATKGQVKPEDLRPDVYIINNDTK